MSSYVAVVGSRFLPASWSARLVSVVGCLLARGRFVGSGGALGADLFALPSLGAGRWVRLRCWAGAFGWVPARLDKERCIHVLIGYYCSLCRKGGR